MLFHRGRRFGMEMKFSEAPQVTRSMKIGIDDLQLEHLWIVYPGTIEYPVDASISVLPLAKVADLF